MLFSCNSSFPIKNPPKIPRQSQDNNDDISCRLNRNEWSRLPILQVHPRPSAEKKKEFLSLRPAPLREKSNSNSGIKMMNIYEIQIYDSYGVAVPSKTDCGAI